MPRTVSEHKSSRDRFRDRFVPAFAHRDFSRLWRANLGTTMSFWMQSIAQGWLVVQLTDSPFVLGLLAFFRSIPMLILSPFGGVLADRFNRIRLLLGAQVLMGGSGLAVGILVAIDVIEVWHLALAGITIGASFALSVPARNALVSDLVPRDVISNAVALTNTTMNASRVVGPTLAGFLIGIIGIAGIYFVQVGGYVWSTLNLLTVKDGDDHPRVRGSTLVALWEGFGYVFRTPIMLALMLLGMSPALFSMPMIMLLPAFVKQDLKAGPEDLGLLMGALGVGAVIGSLMVVTYAKHRYKGPVVLMSALTFGALVVVLAFTRSLMVSGLVLFVSGFFQAVYMATNQSIIQLLVPDHLRGRVLSIWMLSWGLTPLGLLPMAVVAETVGTPVAMVMGGVLSVLVVLGVMIWNQGLWTIDPEQILADRDE